MSMTWLRKEGHHGGKGRGTATRGGLNRVRAVLAVSAILVMGTLVAPVLAKRDSAKDMVLPSCDDARKHYDAGDLYKVLGVSSKADDKTIRKAFKKMSVQCHPDKDRENEHAEDNFIAIAGAYETLGNQEERETYDLNRQRGGASGPGAGGAGGGFGFGGSGQQQQQQQYQRAWKPRAYQDVHVEDVFKRFFGGGASGSGGSGGSGGAFYSQTFGQGGGAGGDDDDFEKVFESMFKNFHFDKPNTRSKSKSRSSSSKPRSQHKRAGGTFTAGDFFGDIGSIFDDLNESLGAFQNMAFTDDKGGSSSSGSNGQRIAGRSATGTARQHRARAPTGAGGGSGTATAKPGSSSKKKQQKTRRRKRTKSSKGAKTASTAGRRSTQQQQQSAKQKTQNTRSQSLRDKLHAKKKSKDQASRNDRCVFSVKEGEVCA